MASDGTSGIVSPDEGSYTPPSRTHEDDGEDARTTWDWIRWAAALLVALVALVWFLNAVGTQNLCNEVLSSSGGAGSAVQLCGPPRLLDLAPYAFVIGILLWPDLSEFAVAGLVTLKRRVREQEARQEALETRLLQVDQRLAQVALLAQGQAQGQSQAANMYFFAPDQEDVHRGIAEKEAGAAPPHEPQSEGQDTDESARLLGEFLREYAELEPYLLRPRGPTRGRGLELLAPQERELVLGWNEVFDREITALRQTRNAAVHDPSAVSAETLRGAIGNTRELARILFDRLRRGRPST
jgi:hypothetical protein